MAGSVFDEEARLLSRLRDTVAEKEELEQKIGEMKSRKKKLSEEVSAGEKSIKNEIESTTKRMRSEVEDGYDKQLSSIRGERKKTSSDKNKQVEAGKASRLKDVAKDIRSETKDTERELKKLFRKNNVPLFCRTKLFYIMFMPDGGSQILAMVALHALFLLAIPGLVMFLLRTVWVGKSSLSSGMKIFLWVFIPLMLFLINLTAIVLIHLKVKKKYREPLRTARNYRRSIAKNDRQIRDLKRSIDQDQDESRYNVKDFDQKLGEMDDRADQVRGEKKNALSEFDGQTAGDIRKEIESRRLPELERKKEELNALDGQLEAAEAKQQEMERVIREEFIPAVGQTMVRENMLKKDRLDRLVAIMEDGQAATIADALIVYRRQKR